MLENSASEEHPSGSSRYVPLITHILAALVIVLIPLKIIGEGFLPPDDALPDAAKAISGKSWPEILVLNKSYVIDNHIGWHALLRQIYLWTNWPAEGLVVFSVASLFLLLGWSALPWLRRPEAWLIVFICVPGISPEFMLRFMLGRPLLISMAALVTILFLWHRKGEGPPRIGSVLASTILIALAVALHGVWYMWALPAAAFFLAREFRWGLAFLVSWAAGTIVGGLLTGHPVEYIYEAARQALGVVGNHVGQLTKVSEMQPTPGNIFGLLVFGAVFLTRMLGKTNARPWNRNPAFWVAALGWALGYVATRFWNDWGLPSLLVLAAFELEPILEKQLSYYSWQRAAVTAGLAATLFLAATSNAKDRWTSNLNIRYLKQGDPALAGWLPDPGGIFYSVDMGLFYQTFYANPKADWRYMVGFEPIFMPKEDFATYQKIHWSDGDPGAYEPWVKKMQPADRLGIYTTAGRPAIPELEWARVTDLLWIGRVPRGKPAGSR